MNRKGKTSQRTILFRRNVNRDNEEWAHFLEGYRKWLMDWDMLEFGDGQRKLRNGCRTPLRRTGSRATKRSMRRSGG